MRRINFLRLGDYYAITACVLGLIESFVSAFEQKFGLIGGYREGGNSDGGAYLAGKFSRPCNVEFLQSRADLIRTYGGLLQRTFGQDYYKLLATIANGQVFSAHV